MLNIPVTASVECRESFILSDTLFLSGRKANEFLWSGLLPLRESDLTVSPLHTILVFSQAK